MTQVIKRGGIKRQSFSPAKIKNAIRKASKEAGFSKTKIEEIVKKVGNSAIDFYKKKRVVKATAIRKSILGRLGRISKTIASAWKRYEKKKKKG